MSIIDPRTGDVRPGRVWAYVIGFAVFVGVVLPLSLYAFGVFSSGVKGKGDVVKKNNDSTNQVEAQATFNALWGDIQSYQTKIANASATLKANPADTFEAQVLTGLESSCSDAVQQYNADANNTTMKEWRPEKLPAQIAAADYCEVKP